MKKQRRLRTAAVLAATIATAGTLVLGAAGSAVARAGPGGGHAGAADGASSSAAVARPDNTDAIAIQQTTSYEGTVCLDGGFPPQIVFGPCAGSLGYQLSQIWSRQASTNGQYKLVQSPFPTGTQCLEGGPNPGIDACQQGDGYQKFNLVLLSDGYEWKIEQPFAGYTFCLTTNGNTQGFEVCQKGDGAQKFTFPIP